MTSTPSPGGPSRQQAPAPSTPADPSASSSFFRWIRGLDISRAPDRWVGGVAGGVARRTGLDLALVRGLIVILAVFGGIGVLLYGLAWALLPEPDGRIHVEQAGRGSWTSGLTGAAALVAIGLWRPNLPLGDGGADGLVWTLFWIGTVVLFVYWLVNRSGGGRAGLPPDGGSRAFAGGPGGAAVPFGPAPRVSGDQGDDGSGAGRMQGDGTGEQPTIPLPQPREEFPQPEPRSSSLPYQPGQAAWSVPSSAYPAFAYPTPAFADAGAPFTGTAPKAGRRRPPRPSGSATALLVGGAIIVASTLLTLDYAGVLDLANAAVVALAAAAIVLALGVVSLGARGRTSGLVGLTAALATLGALVASSPTIGGTWLVAQEARTAPTSLRAASDGYSILAADTTIDLTDLPRPSSDVTVPITSLAGGVTVIVPEDVPVQVRTRMALGRAEAVGDSRTSGGSGSEFSDREGVLQLSDGELNSDAPGAALILEVRGALSDVSILPDPGTTTPTGDTP